MSGYEIHCGVSTVHEALQTFAQLDDQRADGCISQDGMIAGTYLHGMLDTAEACTAVLHWAGLEKLLSFDRAAQRETEINRLADCIEEHMDLAALFPQWYSS